MRNSSRMARNTWLPSSFDCELNSAVRLPDPRSPDALIHNASGPWLHERYPTSSLLWPDLASPRALVADLAIMPCPAAKEPWQWWVVPRWGLYATLLDPVAETLAKIPPERSWNLSAPGRCWACLGRRRSSLSPLRGFGSRLPGVRYSRMRRVADKGSPGGSPIGAGRR